MTEGKKSSARKGQQKGRKKGCGISRKLEDLRDRSFFTVPYTVPNLWDIQCKVPVFIKIRI
jgi:hypothetical protein